MGIEGIDHVIDKIKDENLKQLVSNQKKEYGELKEKFLKHYPYIEDKKNIMVETMLEIKTLFVDDSDIVKMLMKGCQMAVITMTEVIHKNEDIDEYLKQMADDLEDISKKYEEQLKSYL